MASRSNFAIFSIQMATWGRYVMVWFFFSILTLPLQTEKNVDLNLKAYLCLICKKISITSLFQAQSYAETHGGQKICSAGTQNCGYLGL